VSYFARKMNLPVYLTPGPLMAWNQYLTALLPFLAMITLFVQKLANSIIYKGNDPMNGRIVINITVFSMDQFAIKNHYMNPPSCYGLTNGVINN
jgi:hypothetical protein